MVKTLANGNERPFLLQLKYGTLNLSFSFDGVELPCKREPGNSRDALARITRKELHLHEINSEMPSKLF